ncbi:hypothetical protein ITX31_03835 [Arthrobacter gandavensis]|uniref:hypothetical protein n=1 Tax=Arthrobacter gandavensis TaxID=169960 RepID=UPI00188EBC45|nr:hypothetical protein [Arthrobacter gandavensis]MBF4993243.1 hypothetical protein [Arthrobacter gandavensis]
MGWGEFWPAVTDWAITWIPVLGPLGILATALVAYFAYRQKLEADRRAQWWVRAQWALEASLSANPRRSLAGLAVLNDLKTSSLATREDQELFRLIGATAREELAAGAEPGPAAARMPSPAAPDARNADDCGPEALRARPGGRAGPEPGPVLESALRTQVEKLAGEGPEPPSALPGLPGAPTVGEVRNH